MARHIDADKLWAEVNDIGGCGAKPDSWEDDWDKAIDAVIGLIEDAPAADVQEVKHGRWLTSGYDARTYDVRAAEYKIIRVDDPFNATCSICGGFAGIQENYWYPHNRHDLLYPFCPHCGAKMDGKEKE